MSVPLIELQNATIARGGVVLVSGVNLAVMPRRVTCIIGRSGEGKTSLLNVIAGLENPSSGRRVAAPAVFGAPDLRWRRFLRSIDPRKIAFMFQSPELCLDWSVIDNIALPLLALGHPQRPARESARSLGRDLGIPDQFLEHRTTVWRLSKPSKFLSAGEMQRVSFARALITNPKVVFADEPTGNVDEVTRDDLWGRFVRLLEPSDSSVVIVTHDLELAVRCDDIYLVKNKRLELVSKAQRESLRDLWKA